MLETNVDLILEASEESFIHWLTIHPPTAISTKDGIYTLHLVHPSSQPSDGLYIISCDYNGSRIQEKRYNGFFFTFYLLQLNDRRLEVKANCWHGVPEIVERFVELICLICKTWDVPIPEGFTPPPPIEQSEIKPKENDLEPWRRSRPKKQERDRKIWEHRNADNTWEDVAEYAACSVSTAKIKYELLQEITLSD